jgi:hypothetical protein
MGHFGSLGHLFYNVGPDSYVIDFVVTNPSTKSLKNHGFRAYEVTNGAAIQAEKLKRQHYATAYPPIQPRLVIPFAIEATGRLGPSALAFLIKICGTQTFRRSKFLKYVSMICARFVGIFF